MTDLPVNVDTAYADDATHADVKLHQQHHDALHFLYNFFEQAIQDGYTGWPDGSLPFFNQSTDRFEMIDPAIAGSPGPPGADGADGVSITPKGNWSAVTAYVVGDLVRHDDTLSTYVCDTAHTNQEPPGSNWQLVATDGTNGAAGATGSTGATGAQGLTGPPGPSAEVVEVIPTSGSSQSLDLSTASFYIITLTTDCTIDLEDSLGRAASAATLHLIQGTGAPNDVTWGQVITWFTTDGLKPALATAEDDSTVVTVWQLNGDWYGAALEFGGTPPPEVYPTLGLERLTDWVDNADRLAGGADYTSSSNYQIGNKRVGHVFLIETRPDTDGDPGILTTLTGGGVATWTRGGSVLFVATGTNRRRITHFVGRDTVTTSAAPLVAHINGESRSGCSAIVVRTTESPSSAVSLSAAKDVTASGATVSVAATLGAADDAANRGVAVVARNATAATFTPEGTWTELGTAIDQTNPVVRMHVVWRSDAFDTSVSATLSAANTWGVIATELEQGPLVSRSSPTRTQARTSGVASGGRDRRTTPTVGSRSSRRSARDLAFPRRGTRPGTAAAIRS